MLDPDGSRVDMGALPFDPNYSSRPTSFCAPLAPDGFGCLPDLTASSAPSLTSGFDAVATGMGPSSVALLFVGFQPSSMPYLNGTLCLGGSLQRGPHGALTPGSGPCGNQFDFALSGGFLSQAGFAPGSRFYAQAIYRQPSGGMSGIAISSAVESIVIP